MIPFNSFLIPKGKPAEESSYRWVAGLNRFNFKFPRE